jgi:hypothetical protein
MIRRNRITQILFLSVILIFEILINTLFSIYNFYLFPYLFSLIYLSKVEFSNKSLLNIVLIAISYELFFSTQPLGFYVIVHLIVYLLSNISLTIFSNKPTKTSNLIFFLICFYIYTFNTSISISSFDVFTKNFIINILFYYIFDFLVIKKND